MSKKHNNPIDDAFLDDMINRHRTEKKNSGQQQSQKSTSYGIDGLDSLEDLFSKRSKDPFPQAPAILQPELRAQYQQEADKENQETQQLSDRLAQLEGVYDQAQGVGSSQEIQQAAAIRPADAILGIAQENSPIYSQKHKQERSIAIERIAPLMTGLHEITGSFYKIPRYLYNVASIPQNLAADVLEMPELKANYDVVSKGTFNPLGILDRWGGDESFKNAEAWQARQKQYDSGVYDQIKGGDYSNAGLQVLDNVVQSAPMIASMYLTGGVATPGSATKITRTLAQALPFASMQNEKIKNNTGIPDWLKPVNSAMSGLSEIVFEERFGTKAILDGVTRRARTEGAEAAVKGTKDFIVSYVKKALDKVQPITDVIGNGIEEGATRMAQNIVARATGEDTERGIFDGVEDAIIIGSAQGAGASGLRAGFKKAGSYMIKSQNKRLVNSIEKENDEINKYLESPNLKDHVRESLHEALAFNNERINALLDKEKGTQQVLNGNESQSVDSINSAIDSKQLIADDPAVPAPIREQAKSSIAELEKSIDDIVNEAEGRARTLSDISKKLKSASTPEQVQKLLDDANEFANEGGDQVEYKIMIEEAERKLAQLSKEKPVDADGKPDKSYNTLLDELDKSLDELKVAIPVVAPVDTDTNVGDKTGQPAGTQPTAELAQPEQEVPAEQPAIEVEEEMKITSEPTKSTPQATKKEKSTKVLDDLDASLDALKKTETESAAELNSDVPGEKWQKLKGSELNRVAQSYGNILQISNPTSVVTPTETIEYKIDSNGDYYKKTTPNEQRPSDNKTAVAVEPKPEKVSAKPAIKTPNELNNESNQKPVNDTFSKTRIASKFDSSGDSMSDIRENGSRTPEKKFKKNLTDFSKSLAGILGFEHHKDKKGKAEYANTNIAPAGGDGSIRLWAPNSDYGIYISFQVDADLGNDSNGDFGNDTLSPSTQLMYRVEKKSGWSGGNMWASSSMSAGELSARIQPIIKPFLEKEKASSSEPVKANTSGSTAKTTTIKDKLSSVKEELAAAKKEFFDAHKKLNSGIDPEILAKGIKLMSVYAKAGVLKFADIANDISTDGPELLKEVFNSLKAAYVSFAVNDATDGQLEEMTDLKATKALKVEDFINNDLNEATNETGNGTVPDTIRDNSGEVDGAEQPGTPSGVVQEQEAQEGATGNSTESVSDGGRPEGAGNEGGRSQGSGERTADSTGKRTSRKTIKPKGASEDNGGTGQLKEKLSPDSPDHNFIIDDKAELVPDGDVGKMNANMNAILLLRQLESENRNPTPAEKSILAKFVGWGGLAKLAEGDVNDKVTGAIFSGQPVRLGFNSWSPQFVPSEALQTEGRSFEDIVSDFRKEYQRATADYELRRYLPYQATQDNVSLDYARRQVASKLLTEDELDAVKQATTTSFYTDRRVISSMWGIAKHLGFKGGNVLESSAGIGHFFGLMPPEIAEASNSVGIELEGLTGRILKKLYPQNQIYVKGFQDVKIANNSVDFAIGNVPFGRSGLVHDPAHPDIDKFSLHNYFIAKNLKLLKPGGIAMLITSASTMDSPASIQARRWFSSLEGGNSDFIGAVRLPNNAFDKNAGTQVTSDILIFKKRTSSAVNTKNFFTTENIRSEIVDGKEGPERADIEVNEYYIANPENMIGEMKFANEVGSGGLYGGYTPTLHAKPGTDVVAKIKEITKKLPEGIYKSTPSTEPTAKEKVFSAEKSGKIFIKNGAVFVSEGDQAIPVELKYKTHTAAVVDYIPLRDKIYPLLEAELNTEATDEQIGKLREKLNAQYDKFISKHGYISKHSSWLFELDVDFPLVAALENVQTKSEFNEAGKLIRTAIVTKGDLLTKRVNFPVSIPSKADNYEDAVRISVSYKGSVDPDYIAQLMGTDAETAKDNLIENNLVFENPSNGLLETNDHYLSGNVRTKLEQAKVAANENSAYQRNVEALEDVQPKLIPASGIEFKIGVSYLPVEIYKSFIKDTLGVDADLTYISSIGQWEIKTKGDLTDSRNQQTYAVSGSDYKVPGIDILADTMSNRSTIIKTRGTKDFPPKIEEAPTSAASDMQIKINQDFQRYVKKNEEYRDILEKEYNHRFNNYVEPKYSLPSFEYYPGAVQSIKLRVHQMKAVLRAISQNTLLAHDVGTGKTFSQITIAMELRRLGLAKKPMIVVKNSTLGDFAASFKKLYPTAKILILSKDEINAKNRKLFFGRIATGDWDAVIVPHSQFDMIPDKPERIMNYIKEKIEEMRSLLIHTEEHFVRSRINKEIEALEEQMDSLLLDDEDRASVKAAGEKAAQGHKEKSKARSQAKKEGERIARIKAAVSKVSNRKTDNLIDFDAMGVDALLIDESHAFKRLGFSTNIQKVKGIDVASSKKAVSAYLKTQAVMERTGGKNVIFSTGTPITNTMAELWTNMRFLIPDVLKAMGIETFDQFQQSFTEIGDSIEQNAGGKFEVVQRLARFYNLPELIKTFRSFADVVTTDDIPEFKEDPNNAPPELKGGKVQAKSLPITRTLKGIMEAIARKYAEYKAMSGEQKRENSALPLILYSIGKTAPIDPRLVDPTLEDDPGSKANAVVAEVLRLYNDSDAHKGTQMIFSDYIKSTSSERVRDILETEDKGDFNLYEDLKQKLIKGGIPANEIAMMSEAKFSGSNSDAAKKKLFDLMNQGTIRVVIGSTEKMGVGVNAQERMIGLHHLDAPARPDMFTQRNGRIIRQGNMFAAMGIPVEVRAYGMEGTSDSTAFQRLEKKQGFITQIMKGDVTERSIDDAAAEEQENIDDFFAELGASLSGNKDALKLVMVKKDLRKEENRQFSHQQKVFDSELSLRKQKIAIPNIENKISLAESVLDVIETNFPEGKITEVSIGGKVYNEKIGEELQKRVFDTLSAKIEKLALAKGAMDIRSMDVQINGVDAKVIAKGVRGKENLSTRFSFRVPALEIGTEYDDNAWDDWDTKEVSRTITSESAGGMLQLIRNDISRAEGRPESLKKLLDKTKANITQLEEDLKETFDDTKLISLQKEKARLDALVVAGGKHFEPRKLDDKTFYVFNIDKQEEVKDGSGETIYYGSMGEANTAAARLNNPVDEKEDNPHANIQKALDVLDSAKIKGSAAFGMIVPIPPAVWNAAIDVVKVALKAGNTAQKALRAGVAHILEEGGTKEQATEFYNALKGPLGIFEEKAEKAPGNPNTTTLRNADVAEKREQYGFNEPKQRKGTTDEEFRNKATEALKNGFNVRGLMNRIEAGEAIQGWEGVALAMFQGEREAELLQVDNLIEETPSSNVGDFNALVERRDKIMEDMLRAYDMSEKAGTFASDVLRSRKVKVAQDLSLAGLIAKMRKAGKGRPLSPAEVDNIKSQQREMQQAMKDIEKESKRLQSENDKLKAQLALKKEVEARRRQKKAGTLAELKQERDVLLSDWRQALRKARSQANTTLPYLNELIATVPFALKLARNLVEAGTVEIRDVVQKLHEEFVQEIPELTEEDILEILSGKYSEPKQSKNEIQQELLELRKQATLLLKIKDAENGLARSAPGRARAEASEKVKELRDKLKALTQEGQEEKDLRQQRERIQKRIDELNRRIEEGDFSSPEKKEKLTSPELEALKDKLMKVQFEYEKALATRMLESRTGGEKFRDYTGEILNLPRSLMASVDFSAPLRQGLVMTVSHPVIAAGAAKEMFKQAFSQQKFDRWLFDLQNSEDFVFMQQAGLYISNLHNAKLSAREEQFMSNLGEKIPLIGSLIKGSERAYIGYLNKLRADVFNQMKDILEGDGYSFASNPEVFKSAASFVNNATGRGSLNKTFEQAAPLLNGLLFSPRLIASRLNLLNPIYYAKMPSPVRKMAWQDMGKFIVAATSVLSLIAIGGSLGDDEEDKVTVEANPLSSDFGKAKSGNTRYDILGGFAQYIRSIAQFSTGKRKSTANGEVYKMKDRTEVPANLLRSKLAPLPSMVWNLSSGEDMVGNEYDYTDIPKSFFPLVIQDVSSAIEDEGVQAVLTTGVPALFGVSVQTYDPNEKKKRKASADQIQLGF